jgi:hypothetical protein
MGVKALVGQLNSTAHCTLMVWHEVHMMSAPYRCYLIGVIETVRLKNVRKSQKHPAGLHLRQRNSYN